MRKLANGLRANGLLANGLLIVSAVLGWVF